MNIVDAFPHLRWPSPLECPSDRFDRFTAVEPGQADGSFLLRTASGREVVGTSTRPAPGVVRLRIGEPSAPPHPSPLLVDVADQPVAVEPGDHLAGLPLDDFTGLLSLDIAGDDAGSSIVISLRLGPTDAVYGGGESFRSIDHRGRVERLHNVEISGAGGLDATYLNVPFFWSDAGWGVVIHTGGPVIADLGATHAEVAAFAADGPGIDLFLLSGTPAELLAQYHRITGLPGWLPEWAFGVWMSRCSYFDEPELHGVLDGAAEAGCPVDVLHVDSWQEGNAIAELDSHWEPDRERFPDGWVGRLTERDVRVSLWHCPYVLAERPLAQRLGQLGLLLTDADGHPGRTPDKDDRVLVDLTGADAVTWWKAQVTETLRREGNHAFKPDMAEEVPHHAITSDGRSGRAVRNEYAVRYQAATHAAMVEHFGGREVALFCRSGGLGAQRYPCHWVGDTPSTWAGLTQALRATLSLSLSGYGFVTSDVGGFWTPQVLGVLREAAAAEDGTMLPADVEPELFARWAQWGAVSPLMRFHGTGAREPWAYPEPARSVAIDACRLRDRLRPYLQRAAAETSRTGTPMMRPVPLTHPGHTEARSALLQYLLGPDVLVAPVLEPRGSVTLWVPPGDWEPLVNLAPVSGPGWITVSCQIDQFPAWARVGSQVTSD